MSDLEKLELADRLVSEVIPNLDTRSFPCEGCGHKRYANWTHFGIYEVLTGVRGRLEKAIRWKRGER